MTPETALQILIQNRPDRPKSTDRRQLQKAVDVIIEAMRERTIGTWSERDPDGSVVCSRCGVPSPDHTKYCAYCGAYMGAWEYGE